MDKAARNRIQILNAQESRCQTELNTALEEYKTLCAHAAGFNPNTLWLERLREREKLTNEARATLQARFGAEYSERRLEFAERQIREMLPKGARELRQYGRETQARRKKPPKFRDAWKTR